MFFHFPICVKSVNASLEEQVGKVREELVELHGAVASGNDLYILEEAWDVIAAAEGVLQKYPESYAEAVHGAVFQKNRHRHYYEVGV